jgi:hypothetical protein
MQKEIMVDPTEMDELELEIEPSDELINSSETELEIEGSDDEDVNLTDDGVDSDEAEVVENKPSKPKRKTKDYLIDDVIRCQPQIGQSFQSKYFAIKIVDKQNLKYNCQVTASIPPCKYKIGEIFEANEIAFYSDYYSLVKDFIKK